jgi:hypothetical protein
MSVFKSQFSRALSVIPSDNCDVPYPAPVSSGTNTSAVTNQLVDSAGNFVNLNVRVGDIVYNTTDGTAATVVSVTSATVIVLNADIFAATAKAYIIYQAGGPTTLGNYGCNLYIGGAGNVKVTTIGQDIITFSAIPAGTVLPVQVIKVHAAASGTTATLINALW